MFIKNNWLSNCMNIFPDLVIPSRINCNWTESGIDCYSLCMDKQHFDRYPYQVNYNYNSRGFRDKEWPASLEKLKKSIWCVGDSFTVGIGSPLEHTWPYLLEQKTNKNTVNISLDGASNNWIARRTVDILEQICPETIVIMWSFLHRRELSDSGLTDEKRRIQFGEKICKYDDVDNLEDCYQKIKLANKNKTNIIYSVIPNVLPNTQLVDDWKNLRDKSWPESPPMTWPEFKLLDLYIQKELKYQHTDWYELFLYKQYMNKKCPMSSSIIDIQQLDLARDGYHFDIRHSEEIVKQILCQI